LTGEIERVLAIDLGERRVGYALSDPLGITAQPAGEFESHGIGRNVEEVRRLAASLGAFRVIVGHPLLLSGKSGTQAERASAFAERLRAAVDGVDVELWDERLTTRQAERALISGSVRRKRRREVVDRMAAALLLQSYLDARAAREGR
jgi:putative Holliday junction resolvase